MPSSDRPQAALYFNELLAMGDGCLTAGHLYIWDNPEDPEDTGELSRLMLIRSSAWGHVGDVDPGIVCGFAVLAGDPRTALAVCRDGAVTVRRGPRTLEEEIPADRGYLFGVTTVDEVAYVCGVGGQVFRRTAGRWEAFTDGIRGGDDGPMLLDIHGTSGDNLYVVGHRGTILRYDGRAWVSLEVPTNAHLRRVLCVAPDEVYACGEGGVLLRGAENRWEFVGHEETDTDLWGLADFRGKVYTAGMNELFVVDGSSLERVTTGLSSGEMFYRLSGAESGLWCTTGTGYIYRFDGAEWEAYLCPDNEGQA